MRRLLPAILFAAVCVLFAGTAEASDGYRRGGHGMPWFAYGYSGSLYGLGMMPVPPYYAVHPPVYYSRPVSRTYGCSPYACACDHSGCDKTPEPVMNPHVPSGGKGGGPEQVETIKSMAKVISNPFYDGTQVAQAD